MNKSEQLISCLEGEIAKRDEELAACRVAVENCELFRARVAELEGLYQELIRDFNALSDEPPVSEAKAQGVVQWPEADEIMQMAFEEGQPADDASGYCFELEEFDLFIERLMSEVARLNAAPAAPAADASLIEWTKDAVEWGGALNYAAWEFVNECPEKSALLFNNTKGPLRAAIMKYAEIVAAHRAKGVV